jgi:hypothetical protein
MTSSTLAATTATGASLDNIVRTKVEGTTDGLLYTCFLIKKLHAISSDN